MLEFVPQNTVQILQRLPALDLDATPESGSVFQCDLEAINLLALRAGEWQDFRFGPSRPMRLSMGANNSG